MENVWTPSQSSGGPRGYKEDGKGLRKEGEASRGYSLCHGVTRPRGCENADRTRRMKVGESFGVCVCGHKIKKKKLKLKVEVANKCKDKSLSAVNVT